jgi:DNA end-binding protein Ku
MLEEGKVAVAKTVMGTKEKLLALIPTSEGILANTLFFIDEIKNAPKELPHPEPDSEELKMAKTLVGAMVKQFQPDQHHDEYREKLWSVIRQKIEGGEVKKAPEETEISVVDLMEALRQSLAQVNA